MISYVFGHSADYDVKDCGPWWSITDEAVSIVSSLLPSATGKLDCLESCFASLGSHVVFIVVDGGEFCSSGQVLILLVICSTVGTDKWSLFVVVLSLQRN